MKLFVNEKDFFQYKEQFINPGIGNSDRSLKKKKNTLIIGPMDSQVKSDLFTASLMDKENNYIVFDQEGLMLSDVGNILKKNEYDIKVVNFSEPELSEHFNPLLYVKEPKDIARFSRWIIDATSESQADAFFETCESLFYQACLSFLMEYYTGEKTLRALSKLIACENIEEIIQQVDDFSQTGLYYQAFIKAVSPSTKISILSSCRMRATMLFTENMLKLTDSDTFIFHTKYAIFVNPGEFDSSIHHNAVQLLFGYFRKRLHDSRVRFVIKDFHLMGFSNEIYQTLADKKTEFSFMIGIESIPQFNPIFGENYSLMMSVFDNLIYLSSDDSITHAFISKMLGSGVVIFSGKKDIRPIMTPEEIACLSNEKMIILYRGDSPKIVNKYDIRDHFLYVLTGIADSNNQYDWIAVYKKKMFLQDSLKSILCD